VHRGIDDVVALWVASAARHPLAHHATNVLIEADGDPCRARAVSKRLGVLKDGRVGSVTYADRVVRTPAGWRIAERVATLRRSPT
jgi:hypothetical protein